MRAANCLPGLARVAEQNRNRVECMAEPSQPGCSTTLERYFQLVFVSALHNGRLLQWFWSRLVLFWRLAVWECDQDDADHDEQQRDEAASNDE